MSSDADDDALYELKPVPLLPPAHFQRYSGHIGDGIVSGSVAVAAHVLERLREKWTAFFNGESRGMASEFVRRSSGYQGQAFRRLLRRYSQLAGRMPRQSAQGWRKRASEGLPLPTLGPAPIGSI